MYIKHFNQRLDRSVVYLALISRHFTDDQALSCSLCGSFSHTAFLCPKTASTHDTSASAPEQVKPDRQTPLCYNFNENVYTVIIVHFFMLAAIVGTVTRSFHVHAAQNSKKKK